MDSPGTIVVLLVLAIGLLAGIGVTQYSLSNTGSQYEYTQTFDTTTNGSTVAFNQSNQDGVYYANAVIIHNGSNVVMQPGVDYNWHPSNGTLTVLDGALENETNATIDYRLRIPSQQQKQTASQIGEVINLAYALPLVATAALVISAIALLSSLT